MRAEPWMNRTPAEFRAENAKVEPVIGWAVIEFNKIKIRTVSDTRRAAIVNFLVTERRVMILNDMTDEFIERMWSDYAGKDAEVSFVTITSGVAR
jgi:hypothetical protein